MKLKDFLFVELKKILLKTLLHFNIILQLQQNTRQHVKEGNKLLRNVQGEQLYNNFSAFIFLKLDFNFECSLQNKYIISKLYTPINS